MKLTTLDKLLEDQLKDIYNAEQQLLKALPKMAKRASADGLRDAFTSHLEETRGQVGRLNRVSGLLGIKLTGKKCATMEGLVEEGAEVMDAEGEPEVVDAALIIPAQRVEHYEISAYGSARTLAEHLGHDEAAELLQETLDEESAADEKLTAISTGEVLPAATELDEAVNAEEEHAGVSQRRAGRANGAKGRNTGLRSGRR
jgi:ferritin-like metal-binding protein YciE